MTNTLYTDIFTDGPVLIGRKWFKTPGQFNYAVPAGAKFCRALMCGSGGQGSNWGGSGAFARVKFPVTPAENLKIQVGNSQTASTAGNSSVSRNDNTVLGLADRGRGGTGFTNSGTPGLASNSIGDVLRDGVNGSDTGTAGGAPASDAADFGGFGFGGNGCVQTSNNGADFGGGGHNTPYNDDSGVFIGYLPFLAGTGVVVLEFFDTDPGY